MNDLQIYALSWLIPSIVGLVILFIKCYIKYERGNNNYPVGLKCSGCGRKIRKRGENYCPECGAKMDWLVI